MTERWLDDGATGVAGLIRQLARDLNRLAQQTMTLLKAEFRDSVCELGRNLALLGTATLVAGLALGLLVGAVALWLGRLVGSPAGGFAITGGGLGLLAALLAGMGVRGLRRLRLYPESTMRELGKTIDLLQGESTAPSTAVMPPSPR